MTSDEVVEELKKEGNRKDAEGMARFGIDTEFALGIRIPVLRSMAKKIGKDHRLSLTLWASGYHEARILAGMIDEVDKVTERQMDRWIKDFNSWDLCDQVCANLFDRHPAAQKKAKEWAGRKPEFEKRAGFALMACRAWHAKTANDKEFIAYLPLIEREATDERNFVKKAVNWALRQIGKRNKALMKKAIATAKRIEKIDSKAARWIAKDALREFKEKGGEV